MVIARLVFAPELPPQERSRRRVYFKLELSTVLESMRSSTKTRLCAFCAVVAVKRSFALSRAFVVVAHTSCVPVLYAGLFVYKRNEPAI